MNIKIWKYLSPLSNSFSVWGGSLAGATVVAMVVGAVVVVVIDDNTVVATGDIFVVLTLGVEAPALNKKSSYYDMLLAFKSFSFKILDYLIFLFCLLTGMLGGLMRR